MCVSKLVRSLLGLLINYCWSSQGMALGLVLFDGVFDMFILCGFPFSGVRVYFMYESAVWVIAASSRLVSETVSVGSITFLWSRGTWYGVFWCVAM